VGIYALIMVSNEDCIFVLVNANLFFIHIWWSNSFLHIPPEKFTVHYIHTYSVLLDILLEAATKMLCIIANFFSVVATRQNVLSGSLNEIMTG